MKKSALTKFALLFGYSWQLSIPAQKTTLTIERVAEVLHLLHDRMDEIIEQARYDFVTYEDFGAKVTKSRSDAYPFALIVDYFVDMDALVERVWAHLVVYHQNITSGSLQFRMFTNVELNHYCRLTFESAGLGFLLHTLISIYKKEVLKLSN